MKIGGNTGILKKIGGNTEMKDPLGPPISTHTKTPQDFFDEIEQYNKNI